MMKTLIDFIQENSIALLMALMTMVGLFLTQRHRYKERVDKKQKQLEDQIKERLTLKLENENLKKELERGIETILVKEDSKEELIQEEKTMFVKFLYLLPESIKPAYVKRIDRLNTDLEIRTESTHYRINKFNKKCDIRITDSSTNGIIDSMHVILPWQPKSHTHKSRSIDPKLISKRLSNSDTYVTVSTYCNGFMEGEEDYAIMAEYYTKTARLIVDFSSIPELDKIFERQPDAYRYFDHTKKKENPAFGIYQILKGVYLLEANNLEKGEIIELDFHINWDYLTDKRTKHNKH